MKSILKWRVGVTNAVYVVALATAVVLMRNNNGLAEMLGTVAAVFGLFNIVLAVVFGTGYTSWKQLAYAQGVLLALLLWMVLFGGAMSLSLAADPEALLGIGALIFPMSYVVVAIATNTLIAWVAPKLLAK